MVMQKEESNNKKFNIKTYYCNKFVKEKDGLAFLKWYQKYRLFK